MHEWSCPTWALAYGSFLYYHNHRQQLAYPPFPHFTVLAHRQLGCFPSWLFFITSYSTTCIRIVVFALPLQLTSSPTSPGPSHKLNALSTGDEEEPTKSWQIRGDLPINHSSIQEVLNHSNDRRLQHLQFEEGALLTTIPTMMTSQAIRCPCREAIHQVISPVKAYKRTAENLQIFLSDNVPNPLHNLLHNPLRSQHYSPLHKEQARAQGQLLTNPRLPHLTTPAMHRARAIDVLDDLPLHGRRPL